MKIASLVCMLIAASLLNLVATGFAQDAAYRSFEALDRSSSRYSTIGSAIVPVAAEATAIQFVAAGLPVIIGVASVLRRWPLATAVALVVSLELLVCTWCWMVHAFAAMPFTTG
jgi:hypothetical protein